MGKSEVQSIPVAKAENTLICAPTTIKGLCFPSNGIRQNGIVERQEEERMDIPENMEVLDNQVAGHKTEEGNIGMLKQNGVVFKPITKKEIGEREAEFYETLQNTVDRHLIELRELVPKYYGVKKIPINGKEYNCVCLEDLTKNYQEPCVMDVKIGKRTWDPKASYQKIQMEEKKYQECKRQVGFCIPGFQVYKIYNNQLVKYGKDFGKTLNKEGAEDAIKTFLNADGNGFCRRLIVQFLAALWRIQHWARSQRSLRIYCSSVLLVYDARRLRDHVKHHKSKSPLKLQRKSSLYRPMSMAVLNNETERIQTGFSGQLTKEGPILRPPVKVNHLDVPTVFNNNNVWHKSIHTLKRTHSFQNNYDKDVQNRKQSYEYILSDLCCEQKSEMWATVKLIDLAHVFPAENCDVDRNFLEGIENLVRMFEEFLMESE